MMITITDNPSIFRPNCRATSYKVMVVSPCGKWNVCVSILQRSNNALTKCWLISTFLTFITWWKPTKVIIFFTRLSIRYKWVKVQTELYLGWMILSWSSHTWFEIWLSCKRNNEPSIGLGYACVIGSQWRTQEMDRRMKITMEKNES